MPALTLLNTVIYLLGRPDSNAQTRNLVLRPPRSTTMKVAIVFLQHLKYETTRKQHVCIKTK